MLPQQQFTFGPAERDLIRSVLNEVLNGFALDDFEAKIGKSKSELQNLLTYVHKLPEKAGATLNMNQTTMFRNALRETLHELGIEEFHTRTGYEFEEGKRILQKLDELIRVNQ